MKKILKKIAFLSLLLVFCNSAKAEDVDFDAFTKTSQLNATDEFLIYRPGVGFLNYNSDYLTVDASGNVAGPETITVPSAIITPALTSTLGTPTSGSLKAVSDGASPVDCTTGGGTYDNLCFYDGSTWRSQAPVLDITLHAAANADATNSSSSNTFFAATARHVSKVNLSRFRQVRIVGRQGSVSDTTADLALRYYTSYSGTATDYLAIGTSEVSVPLSTASTGLDSGWVDLATGAKADVWIAGIVLDVTSGATTISNLHAQFR